MGEVKSDIEIARAAVKKPIYEIGERLGIPPEDLVPYATHFKPSLPDLKAIADMLRAEAFAYSRESGKRVEVDAEAPKTIVRTLLVGQA